MFTGTTGHSGARVSAIVVLTGAAILRGGAAAADSNQDDQFLALLDEEGIPALRGVPSLVETAHKVCRTLDAGMPADGLVDLMVNNAYGIDPTERLYARDRLARTEARFITAAVGACCPYDQSKIASIVANPAPGSSESTHQAAAYTHNAVSSGDHRSGCDAHGPVLASLIGAVPSGEVTQPNPEIPAPPPPAGQIQTPHRPMAAPPPPQRPPPPPQRPPPPPQQPPPPPQQVEPPAVGPQPGDAAGGGGGTGGNGGGGNGSDSRGGNGGGGPAAPAPAPGMPPGFVRLAP